MSSSVKWGEPGASRSDTWLMALVGGGVCAAPVTLSPVPRSLNVDMEWLYGASESSNMEVDIGYIPQVSTQVGLTQVRRQDPAAGPGVSGSPARRAEPLAG